MKKLIKLLTEPMVLVIVLGVILFIVYSRISKHVEENNRTIHVSKPQVEMFKETFSRTWNRQPTESELLATIDNYIMDEIFFKEAVAMGLDKSDPTVKLRLRQVLELMLDDFTTIYPTEAQLQKYLSENPDKFRREPRISFQQLYFPFEEKQKAIKFLSELQRNSAAEKNYKGGLMLIPEVNKDKSKIEVERLLGRLFSLEVFNQQTGQWSGTIGSAYGWHLVKVNDRTDGSIPDLNEIWDLVEREWSVERKREIKEEQYKILKDQYVVKYEEYK